MSPYARSGQPTAATTRHAINRANDVSRLVVDRTRHVSARARLRLGDGDALIIRGTLRGDRQAVHRIVLAISQHTVHLTVVVRMYPGAIIVLDFERSQNVTVAGLWRRGKQRARKPFSAASDSNDWRIQAARVIDIRGTPPRADQAGATICRT